jgi:aspartate/methionine/tyrosine aminotransferase
LDELGLAGSGTLSLPVALAGRIPESGIRKIYHEALKYNDVIHLEIGDPDIQTPSFIVEAAYSALKRGYTHYTHNAGLLETRQAIADYYRRLYRVSFDPERHIIVTLGGTEGIFLALSSVLTPGDEVLIPDPGYPSYETMVVAARGRPVRYRVDPRRGFQVDVRDLEEKVTSRTRVVVLNNPHNPTGSIVDYRVMLDVLKLARDYNLLVISDEVYERIVFEGEFRSMSTFSKYGENIVVVNSTSKTFAMTGWRIGFALSHNEELIKTMTSLQEGVAACAPAAFQVAAAFALSHGEEFVKEIVSVYDRRRRLAMNLLEEGGVSTYVRPRATLYMLVDISRYSKDSMSFARKLLAEARVAVAPGSAFGRNSEGYVRITFAVSEDKLSKGIGKFTSFLTKSRGAELV